MLCKVPGGNITYTHPHVDYMRSASASLKYSVDSRQLVDSTNIHAASSFSRMFDETIISQNMSSQVNFHWQIQSLLAAA